MFSILPATSLCQLPLPFLVICGQCSWPEHTVNRELRDKLARPSEGPIGELFSSDRDGNCSIHHPPQPLCGLAGGWSSRKCWWWGWSFLGWLGLSRKCFLDSDREGKKIFFSDEITFLKINYPLLLCYSNLRWCSLFLIIKFSQMINRISKWDGSCLPSSVSKQPALWWVRIGWHGSGPSVLFSL